MKKFFLKLTRPIRRFWFREFEVNGKKFYYGTVAAAFLILFTVGLSIYWFGLIGALVLLIKQGVKYVIAVLAKLTFKAIVILGIKRFVIDFVVMPTMKRRVFAHVIPALLARLMHSRLRIIRWIAATFGGFFSLLMLFFVFLGNGLVLIQSAFNFMVGKLAASFGFKAVWTLIASLWTIVLKYWTYIKTTPLGILIQVYILSWVMDLFGKIIPDRAKRRLRPIKDFFIGLFWKFQDKLDDVLGWELERRIKNFSRWVEPFEQRKKRHHERLLLALERKKQQKQNHPQNDDAQIRRFDAHRSRKHRPD